MLRLYRSMEEIREVPDSMGLGVITVLYKNKGSPFSLKNYRHLSLLNSDYKILTNFSQQDKRSSREYNITESSIQYTGKGHSIHNLYNKRCGG